MGLVAASNCSYDISSTNLIFRVPIYVDATELVRTCPDVCHVIVGYGNPDLAGIGVSYCLPTPQTLEICDKLKYFKIIALRQLLCTTRTIGDINTSVFGISSQNPSQFPASAWDIQTPKPTCRNNSILCSHRGCIRFCPPTPNTYTLRDSLDSSADNLRGLPTNNTCVYQPFHTTAKFSASTG